MQKDHQKCEGEYFIWENETVNETFKVSGSFPIKQPTKTWIEVIRSEEKVNKDQVDIRNA